LGLAGAVTALGAGIALAQGLPTLPDARALEELMSREKERAREGFRGTERLDTPGPATAPRSMPRLDVERSRAPDPGAIADAYRRQQAVPGAAAPELLVFVSFSMPHESLLRLAEQARRADAVLVFRGLAGASLREMTGRLAPLAKAGAAMQINPQAFTRFGIKAVPTFVVAEGDSACAGTACDGSAQVISGDVSLDFALERLASQGGPLAYAAEDRLRRLRGGR
jgi:conjugal transfer pilus assembly protein TrbC